MERAVKSPQLPHLRTDLIDTEGGPHILDDIGQGAEAQVSSVLKNAWVQIEGKEKNYFLASAFERLALSSFWNGDQPRVVYYFLKMLVFAEKAAPGPILFKAYGNVALVSALKGQISTSRKYIRVVNQLLSRHHSKRCVRFGIPAGLRSVGLALAAMGDLESSSSYLLIGMDYAVKLNDFRLQAEIAMTLSFICTVRGGAVQAISYVNRILQISVIRDDAQCRCWAYGLLAIMHLRYRVGSKPAITKKLLSNQGFLRSLEDKAQALDQLTTLALLAIFQNDFNLAKDAVSMLVDFDPVVIYVTSVHAVLLCYFLRELYKRTDRVGEAMKQKRKSLLSGRNTRIVSVANHRIIANQNIVLNTELELAEMNCFGSELSTVASAEEEGLCHIENVGNPAISTMELWGMVAAVIGHLKSYGKVFLLARVLHGRFRSYISWIKGKPEKSRRRFMQYYLLASEFDLKFEKALAVFEMNRLFPDFPATSEERSLPSLVSVVSKMESEGLFAHFQSQRVIYRDSPGFIVFLFCTEYESKKKNLFSLFFAR